MLPAILGLIIGYLLGSIPTAYIVARLRKGIDIRDIGSGNMGAGNVMREIGTHEGVFVGLADMGKGAAAILTARALGASQPWVLAAGFAALVGHSFPVFVGFRGGRGSAAIIGMFLVLSPKATLLTLVIVAIPFFASRTFGGAIMLGLALLPLFLWLLEDSLLLVRYALIVDLFLLVRALPDIRRILAKGIVKDMIHDRHEKNAK